MTGGAATWVFAAMLWFNLACLLLWFIVGAMRRTWERSLKDVETFLALMERGRIEDTELEAAVAAVREHAEKARGLGPIWGRKPASSAQILMLTLAERWPDSAGTVLRRMDGED